MPAYNITSNFFSDLAWTNKPYPSHVRAFDVPLFLRILSKSQEKTAILLIALLAMILDVFSMGQTNYDTFESLSFGNNSKGQL